MPLIAERGYASVWEWEREDPGRWNKSGLLLALERLQRDGKLHRRHRRRLGGPFARGRYHWTYTIPLTPDDEEERHAA